MTNLQNEYNKLLEARRHNQAMELQQQSSIDEAIRHDIETERLTERGQDVSAATTRAGQEMTAATAKFSALLNAQVSREQMANQRYMTEYSKQIEQEINNAKNAVSLYATEVARAHNERQDAATLQKLELEGQNIANNLIKMNADIEARKQELELKQRELGIKENELSYKYDSNLLATLNKFSQDLSDTILDPNSALYPSQGVGQLFINALGDAAFVGISAPQQVYKGLKELFK